MSISSFMLNHAQEARGRAVPIAALRKAYRALTGDAPNRSIFVAELGLAGYSLTAIDGDRAVLVGRVLRPVPAVLEPVLEPACV